MLTPITFLEKDYYSSFNEWIQLYPDLDIHSKPEHLDRIQELIIEDNDVGLAYYFSFFVGYKLYKMQQVILNAKNPAYAFLFASTIPNADIKRLQNVVDTSKNIKYQTKFVCEVNGAKRGKIEKLVVKNQNGKCAYWLLRRFGKISKATKELLFSSGRPRFLYELAKQGLTNNDELATIEDLIIASGSSTYIRLLACNVKGANIDKMEDAILATKDMKQIKKFANSVKGSKLAKMKILF